MWIARTAPFLFPLDSETCFFGRLPVARNLNGMYLSRKCQDSPKVHTSGRTDLRSMPSFPRTWHFMHPPNCSRGNVMSDTIPIQHNIAIFSGRDAHRQSTTYSERLVSTISITLSSL